MLVRNKNSLVYFPSRLKWGTRVNKAQSDFLLLMKRYVFILALRRYTIMFPITTIKFNSWSKKTLIR